MPFNFVDVGISISLMNCKLTDYSTMSLKMLLFICIIQHYLLSALKNKAL